MNSFRATFATNHHIVNVWVLLLTACTEQLKNGSIAIVDVFVQETSQIQTWKFACESITLIIATVFTEEKEKKNRLAWLNARMDIPLRADTYLQRVRLPQGPGRQLTPSVVPQYRHQSIFALVSFWKMVGFSVGLGAAKSVLGGWGVCWYSSVMGFAVTVVVVVVVVRVAVGRAVTWGFRTVSSLCSRSSDDSSSSSEV